MMQRSVVTEINCVIHWFQTWNPRQRQQFLNDLVEKALPNKVDLLLSAMEDMNVRDRPPSIYECQLRLFNQWFDAWTTDQQNYMLERLESFDPTFVEEFYQRIRHSTTMT